MPPVSACRGEGAVGVLMLAVYPPRGDLARASGDRSAAIEWYRRAQAHATNVTSRCDGGNERRKDKCTAATSTKQLAKAKEDEVQASFRKGH